MAFIKRCATVVSFKQLHDEDRCLLPGTNNEQDDSAGDAVVPSVFGPDSAVSDCAGQKIAKYAYAVAEGAVRGPKQQLRKHGSSDLAAVPDIDDPSSPTSSSDNGAFPLNTMVEEDDGYMDSDGGEDVFNVVPTAGAAKAVAGSSSQQLGTLHQSSLLDTVLLALWEDCAERGLFRYDVTACPTKVLPGVYGFVAQLNEGRATKKRPTEFRVDQVCQPFDESKFNFKKAYFKEVLFQFEPSHDGRCHLLEGARAGPSPNLVLINVSPIEYGHVLLVPRVLDCLTQVVDPSTMLLALHFCREAANPYMRVGYNSLGAYATINHLHFQAYYLAAPFPCERAPTAPIRGLKRKRGNVIISRLVGYPVLGFVVETGGVMGSASADSVAACLAEVAEVVGRACMAMQAANVPHNVLIADSGARVFIWPQCFAEKQARNEVPPHILDTGVNPAVFEISGHLVLKRAQDYENITQASAWEMLEQVSLTEEALHKVALMCFAEGSSASIAGCGQAAGAGAGCGAVVTGVEVVTAGSGCEAVVGCVVTGSAAAQ